MLVTVLENTAAIHILIFVVFCIAMSCMFFLSMMPQAFYLQNEAQFLAESQAKYGGYTVEANNHLMQFVAEEKIDTSKLKVSVSAPNAPVEWGTPVRADLQYNYVFKVGSFVELPTPIPLRGRGRAVSTYLEGAYAGVAYTSPSY